MANRITLKQSGATIILTIDGNSTNKTIKEKEERDQVIALVKDLIDKPSKAKEIKVVKIFTANTVKAVKEEENKKIAVKAVEKQVKKQTKTNKKGLVAGITDTVKEIITGKPEDELEKLRKENQELKQKLEAKEAKVSPTPHSYPEAKRY